VPESDGTLAEDRNKDDNRFCKHFLFGLNIGIVEEDIRKPYYWAKKFRQCLTEANSRTAWKQAYEEPGDGVSI